VQFKGGGPAAQSLLAGDTQVMFATSPTVMGFVRSGAPAGALARRCATARRRCPGISGSAEAGLPAYDYTLWFGLYVPTGKTTRSHRQAACTLPRKGTLKQGGEGKKIAVQGWMPRLGFAGGVEADIQSRSAAAGAPSARLRRRK